MKSFFQKVVVLFVVLNLAFGQTWHVSAQDSTPEAPTTTPTPLPPTDEPPVETSTPLPASPSLPATPGPEIPAETPVVEEAPYTLTLASNPNFLTAAGVINLTWDIAGDLSLFNPTAMLEISLPEGVEILSHADLKGFDPVTRLYSLPVMKPTGSLALRVDKVTGDTVFTARLMNGKELLADATYLLPLQEELEVEKTGRSVSLFSDKVRVTFPAESLEEDIILNAGFPTQDRLPEGYSTHVFELKAHAKSDKSREISHFKAPLTVEVDYSDLTLSAAQEDELHLYWYNEETGDWHALESFHDKETKTLRAYTDHFTVFDIGVNDWRATRLPTVESFQVSQFTGAATFTLPIEVPPGPGGFQPNITLSYNSQVVDQATTKAQASWVGMGWSLDGGGSITENGDGSGYMLVVNGVSTQLIQETNGGTYHAMEENFWKVAHDTNLDTWTIYDTNGSVYYFGQTARYATFDYQHGVYYSKPYAWYLTTTTNAFGQALTYDYEFEYNTNVGNTRTDTAAYLHAITYPGNRVRVRFVRQPRTDYTLAYDTDAAVHMYEKQALNRIIIEQDYDGNGVFEKNVRKYELIYVGGDGGGTADTIWPSVEYSAGGTALTLRLIREDTWDGTDWGNHLPATKFTYDNLHLLSATNGYGGEVKFEYDENPWSNPTTSTDYIVSTNICNTGWVLYSGSTNCVGSSMTVLSGGTGNNIINTATRNINRPGGVYEVKFTGTRTPGSDIYVGMLYRPNAAYEQTARRNNFAAYTLTLNKNAHKTPQVYFRTVGSGTFTNVEVKLLPSFYRVTQKTVSDGNNHTLTTQYIYGTPLVLESNYEFRGHDWVKEITPDGMVTKTYFWQDDARKGRSKRVEVYAPDDTTKRSETVYSWGKIALPEYPVSSFYEHAWVRLDDQITRLYDNAGTQVSAQKTVFTYEATYGNLITKAEYDNGGTGTPYRTTTTTYIPRNDSTGYIVNAPARVTTTGSDGKMTDMLYFYDGATSFNAPPTKNILTMTRVRVNAGEYAQTKYTYDPFGNQETVEVFKNYSGTTTNPPAGSLITTTAYDDTYHAYPVTITNPAGQVTTMGYDYVKGVPTSLTDPNNATITAEYDSFGRMLKLIRPGDSSASPTLAMAYTSSIPFTTTITQKINDTEFFSITRVYDGMGRETSTTAGGVTTTTDYVSAVETHQSMPNLPNVYTQTVYDPVANTTTVTAPDGTSVLTSVNGLVTRVTDAKGYVTETAKDKWGRVIQVTPQTGLTEAVWYSYDTFDHLTQVNRSGFFTTMTYDSAGHKTSMSDPDMGNWIYHYTALGNMSDQTDARGCKTNLTYNDDLNRLTSKTYVNCPATANVSYSYDQGLNGVGRRTGMTDGSGSTTWAYDARGRMTSETQTVAGVAKTTSFEYNYADLMTAMTYPDGEVVTFDYNPRMLLESVKGTNNYNYIQSTTYDDSGRMLTRLLGNSLTQAYTYNPWNMDGGRLQNLTTGTLQNISYDYDNVGNITHIMDNIAGETHDYGYDQIHRLTSWTLNGATESYSYDSAGNLDIKSGVDINYSDASHKHAATHIGVTQKYWYDANGNQITRIVGADTFNLIYDAENRLMEVKKNNTNIAQFTYDGDGRRVKSVENGVTTLFFGSHYEITNPGAGQTVTKYYFAGATRIAQRKYTIPQSMSVEYFLGDHLGSTSITTDTAGAKISEMRYKPFGEVRYTWKASQTTTPAYALIRFTFTGQYSYMDDPSTSGVTEGFGLMFYNARWYDPYLNHFTQPDTIVPDPYNSQDYDRYAYVRNNPLRYTDPSGHCAMDADADDCFRPGFNNPPSYAEQLEQFGITLDAETGLEDRRAILSGAILVGEKFAQVRGLNESASEAFRAVYDHINILWEGDAGNCGNDVVSSGGCTDGAHQIRFWSLSGHGQNDIARMIKNVVHEFGHAYDWTHYNYADKTRASNHMSADFTRANLLRTNLTTSDGQRWDWQQSPSNEPNEIFGDMFIAWIYDAWSTDPANVTFVGNAQIWMDGLAVP